MGSNVSKGNLPQAQCPVQPLKQAQNPVHALKQAQLHVQCGLCKIDPRVKWKCVNCDIFLCMMCKDTTHSRKEHRVIDIKAAELKVTNVVKYITDFAINHIAVSFDGSLWIGDGFFRSDIGLFDSATARTGIQNVKVQGNKCKAINTFNLEINCIALTPSNDLLLATNENCLRQIAAGSKKVKDSIYCVKSLQLRTVHVSEDGRVLVGGTEPEPAFMTMIVAMDTNGKHLTNYHTDKDGNSLFRESIKAMTSTHNGNIFAIDSFERVIVLGKTEVINTYTGDSRDDDYDYKRFSPNSLVTTSLDNVIVGHGLYSDEFHVLNNSGNLLTTYDLSNAGVGYITTLAITTEGQLDVLYVGCGVRMGSNFYKMTIAGC